MATAWEIFLSLLNPFAFLWVSAKAFPPTVARLLRERDFATLFSPSKLQEAWFGTFWGKFGPQVKINASNKVLPLLDGRIVNGQMLDKAAGPGIEGVCVEIGAGSGYWVDIFSNKHMVPANSGHTHGRTKEVTRVYGIEPNWNQHASLQEHITKAGLDGIYEIVPVGIEHIGDPKKWDGKIEKESVDCIVSVLCLCSIPEPEKHIKELYSYLKKGGRWYFYEHVRTRSAWYMKAYQRFINIFWPQFLGGCQICRPTYDYLLNAGEWSKVDMALPWDCEWFHVLPHVVGVLTK